MVIVSNEDPYTEDPLEIIDQVWSGVDSSKCEAKVIVDRKEAIQWILDHAKEGDVVLLAGKGADSTMMLKDGQVPWDEREIVKELLKD